MEKPSFDIYHDFIINASINKVYAAISEPEHLINWWPLKCSGKPVVGEEYNFYFTPEYDWYAKVIKVAFSNQFYLKMTKADQDWNSTTFGFDLDEVDNKVQVKFHHIGWPERNDHFRRSSFCWAMLLKGLKDYIEKGKIIPFEERE